MKNSRNMVLIHGAWQGSWAFAAWTPLLQAHGWKVLAVNLPGNDVSNADSSQANLDGYTAMCCACWNLWTALPSWWATVAAA